MSELVNSLINFLNSLLENSIFLLLLPPALGLVFLISFIYILRAVFTAKGRESKAFHKTVLLIKVPKEKKGEKPESMNAENNLNQTREEVAVAETLFSAIAGLKRESGFMAWLKGRNDHVSFEIVVMDSKISFYVAVPDKIKGFVEQQIHAEYPHPEITEE